MLIAIGLWPLLERAMFGSRWGGGYVRPVLLVGVGLAFLLQDLDALPDEDILLPVVIIAIGVGLALSAISQARSRGGDMEPVSVPLDGAAQGDYDAAEHRADIRLAPARRASRSADAPRARP